MRVRWRVDVAHGGRAGHRHDELGGRDRCDGGQLGDGRLLEVDVDVDGSAAAHPQGTARAAARRFAAAYAQVLLGRRAVSSLPLSSSGVLSEAAQVSRPPAGLHTRAITVGAVTGAGNSWATQLQLVTDRGHQTVSADVTVESDDAGVGGRLASAAGL